MYLCFYCYLYVFKQCYKVLTRRHVEEIFNPFFQLLIDTVENLTIKELHDNSKVDIEQLIDACDRLLLRFKDIYQIAAIKANVQAKIASKMSIVDDIKNSKRSKMYQTARRFSF